MKVRGWAVRESEQRREMGNFRAAKWPTHFICLWQVEFFRRLESHMGRQEQSK